MKPMTAAEFFNVTTCLVLPERSAGCLATADVTTGDGALLAEGDGDGVSEPWMFANTTPSGSVK